MEITGIITPEGNIAVSQTIFESLGLKPGDSIKLKYSGKEFQQNKEKTLLGALQGNISVKGDIIAPVDTEWDALS